MKNKFNIADFYILLFVIGDLKNIFKWGGAIGVFTLTLILLISIYEAYEVISKHLGGKFFRALSVLMIMFTIYGLALIISGEKIYVFHHDIFAVSNRAYLKDIARSLLPIYAFYVFSLKGLLTEKKLKMWVIVFFIVTFYTFVTRREGALVRAAEKDWRFDDVTTNAGYWVLGLLPCLAFFRERKILFYFGLGFCVFLIMLGMKRGAIIIGAVCLIFIMIHELKGTSKKEKSRVLFFTIVFFVIVGRILYKQFSENAYLLYQIERTMEGNSSGRDRLVSTLLNYYFNQCNVFQMIFGMGANGTIKIASNYAHNDWVEVLINQGALGLIVYGNFWICMFKEWRKSSIMGDAFLAVTLFVIICFLKTLFSMSYSFIQYYSTAAFCYYLAKVHKNENITCY